MNKKSYNPEFSIYPNLSARTGTQTTLDSVYKRIVSGSEGLKQKTKKARSLKAKDKFSYDAFKEGALPAPIFSGIFLPKKRQAQFIVQHSGLIVLDIDDLAVLILYALRAHNGKRDDIILEFLSLGGEGLKIVVRVNPIPQNPAEHKAAYRAVIAHFKKLTETFMFKFDEQGSDCSRLCALAYDRDAFYNPNATPIQWNRDAHLADIKARAEARAQQIAAFDKLGINASAIDFISPDDYDVWIKVGLACYNSSVPFDVWDTWSQKSEKYRLGETEKKWQSFANNANDEGEKVMWDTVIWYAKKNGYVPPSRTQNHTARLVIDTLGIDSRKARLADPAEVETALNTDIDSFLQLPPTANLQYMILGYDTGTGKSRSTLVKAKHGGKKVLALLENHELAAQQIRTAADMGFVTFGYRGRGYNFENSKLGFQPASVREQDPDLFDKFSVMCAFYDVIEKYTAKRLSPLHVCTTCPFLRKCPYWQQYTEMRQANYLSICKQDLVFNANMRTFLNTITTGKIPFKTPESDEELAIATKLGLDTEAESSFVKFDFVLIDDYSIGALYTDQTYKVVELAALRDAWEGSTTGRYINNLFNALTHVFDKSGTQTMINKLKVFFESLDNEIRNLLNENLTKHPYREANGDITPLTPREALKLGIPLEQISPVWHNSDWTILHQLEAILTHCQNENQAPIFANHPDRSTITLSIPPQPHPAIRKVILAKAKADTEATQASFGKKPIDWYIRVGSQPKYAAGVKLCQYIESRFTSSSIFESERDRQGGIVKGENGKPKRTGKLTQRTTDILNKIAALVAADPRQSVFTSYKEFVDGDFTQTEPVRALHNGFDTVLHYDVVTGRNFERYELFISFGQPKITPKAVMEASRTQHAHDPKPLSFEYELITEEKDGYTSQVRRYTDPRVESVRRQLTTEKAFQAIGRGRPSRWTDTFIFHISAEPIPGFSEFAMPVTFKQLMQAERLEDIVLPLGTETNTAPVIDIPTTADKVSQLDAQGKCTAEIAKEIGISDRQVRRIKAQVKSASHRADVSTQSARVLIHGNCVQNVRPSTSHETIQSQTGVVDTQNGTNVTLQRTKNKTSENRTNGTNVTLQKQARKMRRKGEKLRPIAEKLDTSPATIARWCNGIAPAENISTRILSVLSNGEMKAAEMKAAEIIEAVDAKPYSVRNELNRLLQASEIVKVRRGVYALPQPERDILAVKRSIQFILESYTDLDNKSYDRVYKPGTTILKIPDQKLKYSDDFITLNGKICMTWKNESIPNFQYYI